jgi:hypothetical protein
MISNETLIDASESLGAFHIHIKSTASVHNESVYRFFYRNAKKYSASGLAREAMRCVKFISGVVGLSS